MKFINIAQYCLQKHPLEKIALILVDDIGREKKYSYKELIKRVLQLAAGLQSLKLSKGDVIVIQSNDTEATILLFLAAIYIECVPLLVLFSQPPEEISFILQDANAKIFFHIGKKDNAKVSTCKYLYQDDYDQIKQFPATTFQPQTKLNDPAFLFYTSGSTGSPKGVLHGQRSILGRKPSLSSWLTLNEDDIVLQTDNIAWTYSMFTGLLDPLTVGATALIYTPSNISSLAEDHVSAQTWFELIAYYKISVIASTPDMFATLLSTDTDISLIPSLRMAGSAGAPLPENTQLAWQQKFKFPIYSALGMSELSTFISTGRDVPHHKGTIGKIQPGRLVSILPLEEGESPVSENTTGMLAINRDELGFMLRYTGKNSHDEKKFRGRWFLTQDLVSQDEEGYIHFYGRADFILKIDGGFRVSPLEVENAIKDLEEITDAACGSLTMTDENKESLVAYIVSSNVSIEKAKNIIAELKTKLSDYKIPRYFYFVSVLPRNDRGKLQRKQLSSLKPILVYQND